MAQTLINGIAYSWSQISVNILGASIVEFSAINYAAEQEVTNNYGKGNQPTSRGYGNFTYTASITLSMNELEKLQDVAPNRRLQDIPEFDITVAYVPQNGLGIVRHVIKNCRITNNGREVAQNDPQINTSLTLAVGDIQF